MPRNGSGTYTLPEAAFVPGTTIQSAAVNDDFSDIASALTGSLATDGQSTMTGGIKAMVGSASQPSYTFAGETNTGFYKSATGIIALTFQGTGGVYGFSANGFIGPGLVPLTVPVGAIMDFAGTAAPSGWILCHGGQVSQTTYALLFAVIGTTYNTGGESAGNFRLPDYRGRTGFGVDNMGGGSPAGRITNAGSGIVGTTLGATGGAQSSTLATANVPSHTHAYSGTTGGQSANHTHTTGVSAATFGSGGFSGAQISGTGNTTSIQSQGHTHDYSGTTDTGSGSGTAFGSMNPAIIVNKIIFAGA